MNLIKDIKIRTLGIKNKKEKMKSKEVSDAIAYANEIEEHNQHNIRIRKFIKLFRAALVKADKEGK